MAITTADRKGLEACNKKMQKDFFENLQRDFFSSIKRFSVVYKENFSSLYIDHLRTIETSLSPSLVKRPSLNGGRFRRP